MNSNIIRSSCVNDYSSSIFFDVSAFGKSNSRLVVVPISWKQKKKKIVCNSSKKDEEEEGGGSAHLDNLVCEHRRRSVRLLLFGGCFLATHQYLGISSSHHHHHHHRHDLAEAVTTSRRALRGSKIPENEFTTLPNGLKYYDLKVGEGAEAFKGSRVAVHYVAKWKGITFMTSRQGMGVGGGTPYGFDVGQSERGIVLKGLDLGVQGMRVGGQRILILPPNLAYGSKGVQEIPPNATIEMDVELLAIKQTPFGSAVKVVEG